MFIIIELHWFTNKVITLTGHLMCILQLLEFPQNCIAQNMHGSKKYSNTACSIVHSSDAFYWGQHIHRYWWNYDFNNQPWIKMSVLKSI